MKNNKRKVIQNKNKFHISIPKSIVDVFHITNKDCVEWDYDKENDCFIIKLIQE